MTTLTQLQQIRLIVGDTDGDFPFLADTTYEWLIELRGSIYAAGADALEMIINQLALSPQSIKTQDLTEVGPLIAALEARLASLKKRAVPSTRGFPMLVKSDRKDWKDIDSIYRNCNEYV